jgi:arylsulfatase A-like enzyme/Tfp pilus assembly protein PilF
VRPHWLVPILLVALVFAVFLQVRDHEFVDYDDHPYILENPNLRDGLGLESATRAFTTPYVANWIPLTWISLQIDHELYGLEPAGYHLTNVALHALSAVLLFFALARMTRAPWPSAFVAAVFAVHPLHVESVAWATERKDTLCGLFWMFTLYAYARYAERPERRARYALVVVGVACALLAKSLAVTLPFALLLLDNWPLGRLRSADGERGLDAARLRRALIEKLPLLALAAAAGAITYLAQEQTGVVRSQEFSFSLRVANALVSYALYLRDAIWPTGLAAFYPYPAQGISGAATLAAAVLLGAITALAVRTRVSRPHLLTGWLWYLGTLVPMIGIVQVGVQARADRYTYIPLIGVAIMVAWSGAELAARWRALRIPLAVAGAGAVAGLATLAFFQVGHWRDTVALFEHAIAVTDGNYLAHHRLAATWHTRGDDARAERHYRETLRLNPYWAAPHLEYASILYQRRDFAEAVRRFEKGLRLDPEHARARRLLGIALVELGRYPEAQAQLTRALAQDDEPAEIHVALGMAALGLGRHAEAIEHNREALRLDPDKFSAANNLAWMLSTHPDPALRNPEEALHIAESARERAIGDDPDLLDTLAAAYAAVGRYEEAVDAEVDAIRTANVMDERGKARDFATRLALYRSGRSFVDGQPPAAIETPERGPDALHGALLIVLDTVRADHLSAYGYRRPTSPALERLAARGVLFEQAISSAPWTLPSVAALLAGDDSARSFDAEQRRLQRSLVEAIVRAGFATVAFTEGGFVSRYFGLDRGFLEYVEQEGAVQLGSAEQPARGPAGGSIEKTFAAARAWLDRHGDAPFFALIHTYEPHTPYTRHTFTEGLERGRIGAIFGNADLRELQRGGAAPTPVELRYLEVLYDGGIRESDRQVGALLAHLEQSGLAERTLVVVTSDHGEELGEHFPHHAGDHGHSLRDTLVRVPLILANPLERYPVERVSAQVRSVDILPTMAALLGAPVPEGISGRDLTPLLRGRAGAERVAFGAFTHLGPNRAFVRSDGFKYIATTEGEAKRPMATVPSETQLYDLRADPTEQRNLAGERPELRERLGEELWQQRQAAGHGTPAPSLEGLPDELRERLESLGYVE